MTNIHRAAFALVMTTTLASAAAAEPKTYPLWPDAAPGASGTDAGDAYHAGDIPTITVYLPHKDVATGASVVICPGGGYSFLAADHEGKDLARWLNTKGVAGIVLKYRLAPKYKHPSMLMDAQRALRTVRAKADEWHLDPKRVGIMGFSAGGHLASTAATHFDAGQADASDPIDRQSCRPDCAILVYAVIALGTDYAHGGSRSNLLGKEPDKELLMSLSNETQVTAQTPPTFLVSTIEDTAVPIENSLLFAQALRKNKVPFEMHFFEKGPHGLGMGTGWEDRTPPNAAFAAWPELCATWLKGQGFLTH